MLGRRRDHFRRLMTMSVMGGLVLAASFIASARASDSIRVGKAVAHSFAFSPLDVGIAKGFYRDAAIEIEEVDFGGAAKSEQGIAAGAIDIALSAGTDLALIAKGVPATCIAALAGPPYDIAIVVAGDSPLRSLDDLRGKSLSASTAGGSMMEWIARELARAEGWRPDEIRSIAVGGDQSAKIAALKTHAVDGVLDAPGLAFRLEEHGEGRLLAPASDFVKDFMVHGIFAANSFVEQHPDAVRRFLATWFKTIAYMREHRDETIKITARAMGEDEVVGGKEYDLEMPMFSTDGRFQPAAMAKLASSFAELKMTEGPIDLTKLYTERFLPGDN